MALSSRITGENTVFTNIAGGTKIRAVAMGRAMARFFGTQFAQHHLNHRSHDERQRRGQGDQRAVINARNPLKRRPQQGADGVIHHEAQDERADRDAQLRAGELKRQRLEAPPNGAIAPSAAGGRGFDFVAVHGDQCELGAREQAVDGDQAKKDQETEQDVDDGTPRLARGARSAGQGRDGVRRHCRPRPGE